MFWTLSIGILLLTGLATLWPLLGRGSNLKAVAGVLILLIPVAGYFMYQNVGTPRALEMPATAIIAAGAGDMNALTAQLRSRLEAEPDNVEGWVLLGRSYKTLQQYPQALEALENASRLAPDDPLVMVELVEAQLFVSGNPQVTAEMSQTLKQAVSVDPALQKGLWLLGIGAAQAGDDRQAVDWWNRLLAQLEPGSGIAQSVQEQISQASMRLGDTAPPTTGNQQAEAGDAVWEGLEIIIELAKPNAGEDFQLPADAAVFVIARAQGSTGGPPLGVSRIPRPEFPLVVKLTDENSMLPQRPISSAPALTIQARLSLSGQPIAAGGDWQSQSVSVGANEVSEPVSLVLTLPGD